MATLIEFFQNEDVSRDLKQFAKRLDQISEQRLSQLNQLAQAQLDEAANAAGFINLLDDASPDQIKSENRSKIRAFARKQWRLEEIQPMAASVIQGALNQNDTAAELMDRLIDQIAIDTGSNFATLMAAITAANTARNA